MRYSSGIVTVGGCELLTGLSRSNYSSAPPTLENEEMIISIVRFLHLRRTFARLSGVAFAFPF